MIVFALLVVVLGYPLKLWAYVDHNHPSNSELRDYLSSSAFWAFDEQNLLYGLIAASLIYGIILAVALVVWSLCSGCVCALSFILACIPWPWRRKVVTETARAGHYVRGEARKPLDGIYDLERNHKLLVKVKEDTKLYKMEGGTNYEPITATSLDGASPTEEEEEEEESHFIIATEEDELELETSNNNDNSNINSNV